ncbi:LORF2 protein, partial [Crocuta crocuta]
KTVWRFLQKLKIEISYNPVILLLSIYPKKTKTLIQKDLCTPMFTVALLKIAKIWKQSKGPLTDECVHTHDELYIYKGNYSAIKKNEILPFPTTWMDTEGIMLNEVSQRKKNKYYMISLICGI